MVHLIHVSRRYCDLSSPHPSYSALYYIGITLFILNILYFALLLLLQLLRFTLTPASFTYTLTHPIECCFLPTPLLAFATLINCTSSILIHEYNPTSSATAPLCGSNLVHSPSGYVLDLLRLQPPPQPPLLHAPLLSRRKTLHHNEPGLGPPIFPLMLCGSISSLSSRPNLSGMRFHRDMRLSLSRARTYAKLHDVCCSATALMTVGFPPPKARMGVMMCCGRQRLPFCAC